MKTIWLIVTLVLLLLPIVGMLLGAAWMIGRGSEARGSATDWSGTPSGPTPAAGACSSWAI